MKEHGVNLNVGDKNVGCVCVCMYWERFGLDRVWQVTLVKDKRVNILHFVGHIWSLLHNLSVFLINPLKW